MSSDSALKAMPRMPTVRPRRPPWRRSSARHDVGRHPLVDLHRRLAHREVVARERRQLHRVLEQARTGGEARGRAGRRPAGSPARMASQDVRVVHARLVGDHEELVRDGELHVAPGVREELGELGLLGGGPDRSRRQGGRRAPPRGRPRRRSSAPTIWGSVRNSSSAWPSAIRSGQNATSTGRPRSAKRLGNVRGGARVDGAPQDDERAVRAGAARSGPPLARRRVIDGPRNSSTGVPITIDQRVGPADHRRVGRELRAGRSAAATREQLVRAGLAERHLARG